MTDFVTSARAFRTVAVFLGALAMQAGLAQPVVTQSLTSFEISADNEYFTFWKDYWERGDHDYTHGTKFRARITDREAPDRFLSVELGQLIFNPSHGFYTVTRPYSGWLYLSGARVQVDSDRRSAVGGYLGVTGDPSMAEAAQNWVHGLAGKRSQPDWDPEVPFGLGAGVFARYGRDLFVVGNEIVSFTIPAALGGEIGTASIAGRGRIGAQLTVTPLEALEVRVGVDRGLRAKAWDLFLNGQIWDADNYRDYRMAMNAWVDERVLSAGFRAGEMELEYAYLSLSREYPTQARPHSWSTITLRWRSAGSHISDWFTTWYP